MTHKEACEFFANSGNVCGVADQLMRKIPTQGELDDACAAAISRGFDPNVVSQAREAILRARETAEAK
jgi:hypothetical protein